MNIAFFTRPKQEITYLYSTIYRPPGTRKDAQQLLYGSARIRP